MIGSSVVRAARPEERALALRFIFKHSGEQEREGRVANALRLLQAGEFAPAGLLVLDEAGQVGGAMACLPVAGASGLVWPPQVRPGPEQKKREDRLLRHAVAWLRDQGAKLGQALLPPEEAGLAVPLLRHDFRHITRLLYLRLDLDTPSPCCPSETPLAFVTYDRADPEVFHRTLQETYEGTLDCPEVNGVRSMDEVIAGHQAQGPFEPARWWLALDRGQPVGVLLLADLPELDAWDVSYVGVVPAARRRGVGRALLHQAVRAAKAADIAQLTLSVDARNRRARDLYASLGFRPYDERDVYLAVWR